MDFRIPGLDGKKKLYKDQYHPVQFQTPAEPSIVYTILYVALAVGVLIFILIILRILHSSFLEGHHEECPCVACRLKPGQRPQSIELNPITSQRTETKPFLERRTDEVTNINEIQPVASTSASAFNNYNHYSDPPGRSPAPSQEPSNNNIHIPNGYSKKRRPMYSKSVDWAKVEVLQPIEEQEYQSP